jgi:hypothetical protein
MSSLVSILAICYVLYAGCYMPNLSTSFYMLYGKSRMTVIVYLHLYANT